MATDKIYSVLNFVGIPLGGTATLPHGLILRDTPVLPDRVDLQFPADFEFVSQTSTTLTIRNTRNAIGNCTAWVYAIHPVQRLLGLQPDDGLMTQGLIPRPFVPGSPNGGANQGSGSYVVVFKPGGVATENVVTTWADAIARLALLKGDRVLQFDDSLVSPIVIPAGGPYDMTNVTWAGSVDSVVQVRIPEGASFTRLRSFTDNIHLRFTGATPPISDFSGLNDAVKIDNGAQLSADGAGAMMDVGASSSGVTFYVGSQAGFFFVAHAVVNVSAARTVVVFLQGGESTLAASTFAGIVGSTLSIFLASSAPATAVQTSQAAFLGTLTYQNNSRSFNFPSAILTGATTLNDDAPAQLVRVDPTGGAFALTLPAAVDVIGQTVKVVNVSASANNVTITAGAGDNINGAATLVESGAHFHVHLTSDGIHTWYVTG